MSTLLLETTMAKKTARLPQVKLRTEVYESAQIVATLRGESLQDLVSNILEPALKRMEADELAKRTRQISQPRKPGGGK